MALQPRTKAYGVAAILAAFAIGGPFEMAGESFALIAVVSGAMLVVAASLIFRWSFARIAALIILAPTAMFSIFAIAYNLVMLFVVPRPTGEQIVGCVLSIVIGVATALSTSWLAGAQAKAHLSRVTT